MIDISANLLLTASGGAMGVYILFYHMKIVHKNKPNHLMSALPIIIGTLAWISTCYEFIALDASDISLEMQRTGLVISWVWLAFIAQNKDNEK